MAVFDTILVPVDGSRPSEVGAALAIDLAKAYRGKVCFVNIVDVSVTVSTLEYAAVDAADIADEAHANGERLVAAATANAQAHGLEANGTVLDGPVLERLLDAIVETHATVIVMGSHGRGGLARALMGSTTDGLLRRSTVPVMVAPRGTPRNPG